MLNKQALLQAYRKMREIRTFEERLHQENTSGDIPGFIHCVRVAPSIIAALRVEAGMLCNPARKNSM